MDGRQQGDDQGDGNARGERTRNVLASGTRPEAVEPWQTPTGVVLRKACPQGPEVLKMAYNQAAIERRRCMATKADGTRCRAFALWDDPRQRCWGHAGRPRRRKYGRSLQERLAALDQPEQRTRYVPCRCAAYAWPHRPGGGWCRWPLPPVVCSGISAGTHSRTRLRPPRVSFGVIPDGGNQSIFQKLKRAGHPSGKWED